MVALQTDVASRGDSTLGKHIRGYGCKLCVGIQLATIPWSGVWAVTAQQVYDAVDACLKTDLDILKDNDVPTTEPDDKWFRVEVQDMKRWIEWVSRYFGRPVTARRCSPERLGNKEGMWLQVMLDSKGLPIPEDCNAMELEWDADGLTGGLSHFTEGDSSSKIVRVLYNPDPTIPRKSLVSARFWHVEQSK
jgi:hypothetical protein